VVEPARPLRVVPLTLSIGSNRTNHALVGNIPIGIRSPAASGPRRAASA